MGAYRPSELPHIGEAARAQGRLPLPDRRRPVHRRRRSCRARPTPCSCARRTRTRDQAAIDTPRRSAAPGVVAIFTGADLAAKIGGLPCGWLITQHRRHADEGAAAPGPRRMARCAMSATTSRMVVAETLQQAKDAAEADRGRLRRAAGRGRHRRRAEPGSAA